MEKILLCRVCRREKHNPTEEEINKYKDDPYILWGYEPVVCSKVCLEKYMVYHKNV